MARGSKGKYHKWRTEEGLRKIEAWARDGLIEEQICHNMGIGVTTLNAWKQRFPEILEALKKGKEDIDNEVENALLNRARGFEYKETISEIFEMPDGTKRKHIKEIKKYALPDTTAQIFWLKNRRPDKWRDKQERIITSVEDLTPLAEMINATDEDDRLETTVSEA